jgi:hypothetical protein
VSLFYWDDIVPVAMQDQHGAIYFLRSFRYVDLFQIVQQGNVNTSSMVEGIACFTPLLNLRRCQQPARETLRVHRRCYCHNRRDICVLGGEK